jgi:pyruvate formate lyase activating enzyme
MSDLANLLDQMTVEGELYEKLPEDAVRCYACGHRCLIREGRRGICKVRYNRGGTLYVPWGYVAALQADPIEKKPFFHILPGVDALTFGMLGCDFHCSYCFPGETVVITNHGPETIAKLFASARRYMQRPDAEIAFPDDLCTVAGSGELQPVRAIFRHPYQGKFVTIKPYYLPELRCTADHRIYATQDTTAPPTPLPAHQLTEKHYLAIPRPVQVTSPQFIDVARELADHLITYRVRWNLSQEERRLVAAATHQGETSRQIGARLGKDASYIRHVRSKLAHGGGQDYQTSGPLLENSLVRYPNEHRPGISQTLPLDENFARLLGYYCAEGSVVKCKNRPNSLVLSFSFALHEREQAETTRSLLKECLNVDARIVKRPTTLGVSASKASAALLFLSLAGKGAGEKHVPEALFNSPPSVVRAFLEAYVEGDGHRFKTGKTSVTTVSVKLAYGIAWLALQLGYFASVYDSRMPEEGVIQGRTVRRSPHQYTVVWYEGEGHRRKVILSRDYYLVPLRSVIFSDYEGDVFNLEVEAEHNYLANLCLVSNCQNHITSQALRDPVSDVSLGLVRQVTPEDLVDYARLSGAQVIASSYNEPLITSEWAVAVFKQAQAAGLKCVYISNGNATLETLQYLRPYLVGYKIDLKSMQDRHYRELGGVLQHVLDSIRMARELGLWVEVVTLIIPGFNDSPDELMDAARYIASVSPEIPWHVTAFHPDYKMTGPAPTSVRKLIEAAEIGQEAGLHYVYAGNLPGRVNEYENTYCPKCRAVLIERSGFTVHSYHVTAQGACSSCGAAIPGVWTGRPETVNTEGWGLPRLFFR